MGAYHDSNYWIGAARRRLSRRHLIAAGGAGLAGAALIGCSTQSKPSQPASSSTNQAGTQTAASGKPQSGGTYNWYYQYNATLDPQKSSAGSQTVVGGVYSRIFRFKTGFDPNVFADHDIENDLGVSAESPDAVTWTVKLRPDAKFHNVAPVNGHAVEAEDVKATFQRALDPATSNPNRGSLGMIDLAQIQTPDKQTIVFKLNYAYAPFRKMLASPAYAWIYPREVLSGGYDPAKTVIGSGPFTLDSVQPDVAYAYKKNADWFDKPRPYIDAMRLSIIPDAAQQLAQFSAGNLDEIIIENPFDLDSATQRNPKARQIKALDGRPFPIYLNLSDPTSPFQDIRVRQAVSMAIDRDALSKLIYNGQGVGTLFVPAYMGKWAMLINQLDANTQQWYKYNPDEAKKLLAAAGQSNLSLRFVYIINSAFTTPPYVKMGEAVSNMLNQAGIKTTIVQQDYNKDYIDSGKGSRQGYFDKDMVIYSGIASYTEADEFLFNNFHSKSTSNDERLSDPQLDTMIDKERTVVDENERLKAVQEIEKYIAAKVYVVPTMGAYRFTLVQPRIQEFDYTDGLGKWTETYAKLWIKS